MKTLEEAKKLDPEGILEEVRERRSMMGQMVGWLYPSILRDEIEVLVQEYNRRVPVPDRRIEILMDPQL